MKALSLWQPWATAIALGIKLQETRNRDTNYRGILAIHAAKRPMDGAALDVWQKHLKDRFPATFGVPHGAIVCVVNLYATSRAEDIIPGTRDRALGDYSPGRWVWLLAKPYPLKSPVPAQGKQMIWDLPIDVEMAVLEQL